MSLFFWEKDTIPFLKEFLLTFDTIKVKVKNIDIFVVIKMFLNLCSKMRSESRRMEALMAEGGAPEDLE